MKTWLYLAFFGVMLLAAFSCRHILTFTRDFEFDLIFKVNTDTTSVYQSELLDVTPYISGIEQSVDKIETVKIDSVTCYLSSFSGTDDQILTNGLLTISDEDGFESQVLTTIPTAFLKSLLTSKRTLYPDEAGISLAEDLLRNNPHKCQGILTGNVSSSPVKFTMRFHVKVTVRGSLL